MKSSQLFALLSLISCIILFILTANKNTVPGDKSALNPGGLRIGTPAVTSRNMREAEMEKVAEFIDQAIKIALEIELSVSVEGKASALKDFKLKMSDSVIAGKIGRLSSIVEEFSAKYPMPGY